MSHSVMAHVFFTGHLVMLNIGYLVHWTTIVDHSRGFLAFRRESIKSMKRILNKSEIVKYEGRFVGKQGGL